MSQNQDDLIRYHTTRQVTTIQMNNPRRLNGWTMPMMEALHHAMDRAASDPESRAVILTGTDPYYSAGVNLGGILKPGHPRLLRQMIIKHNQGLFDRFLDFPKPILATVNGPAIGASVTSATLCDAILASDKATFSTPFARLGVPPEGCSSVLFPRLIGAQNAERILGPEGWAPTGAEAAEIGLADQVVPHDDLLEEAQRVAEGWVAEGKTRSYRGEMSLDELKAVNAEESVRIADAFLGPAFLWGQFRFLWSKKKYGPALTFLALLLTRPLWSQLL